MPRLLGRLIVVSLLTACAQTVATTQGTADAGNAVDLPGAGDDGAPLAPDAPAPDGGPAPTDAPGPAVDAGGAVSDDCRRGTWCWERPVPTGESAVAAAVPSADRMVFITEGGTLATWEGGRWSTRRLALPGSPTGLFVGADGEVIVTAVDQLARSNRWIVEFRGDARREIRLEGDGHVSDPRAGGAALWAAGSRELFRRRGTAWETVAGPAGAPVISGYHVVGPDEVVALESWGSGSGAGVLHRYRAGAWEVLVDFRDQGFRVDGPVVAHDGALWMRTFDTSTRTSGVIRVAGTEVALVEPPRGLGTINLHGVGDDLWLIGDGRAWVRRAGDWTPVTAFPGRPYGVVGGFGTEVAWALSDGVHRRRSGAWESLGESAVPTGNFWNVGGVPLLVAQRPAGFLFYGGTPRPSWRLAPLEVRSDVLADSPPVEGVGYLATADGVVAVRGRTVAGPSVAWPSGTMRAGAVLGGSAAGLWAWGGERRLVGYVAGAWSELAAPTFPEAPAASYTIDAIHFTADARLFVAATALSGDKQVRRRVFVREGTAWRQIVSEMGVFGRTEDAVLVGDRADGVWIGLSGLYRYDGATAARVAEAIDVQGLARRADGGVVALTPGAVEAYSARGLLLDRVALPAVRGSFNRVHHAAGPNALRVANGGGWVMRYTP